MHTLQTLIHDLKKLTKNNKKITKINKKLTKINGFGTKFNGIPREILQKIGNDQTIDNTKDLIIKNETSRRRRCEELRDLLLNTLLSFSRRVNSRREFNTEFEDDGFDDIPLIQRTTERLREFMELGCFKDTNNRITTAFDNWKRSGSNNNMDFLWELFQVYRTTLRRVPVPYTIRF